MHSTLENNREKCCGKISGEFCEIAVIVGDVFGRTPYIPRHVTNSQPMKDASCRIISESTISLPKLPISHITPT